MTHSEQKVLLKIIAEHNKKSCVLTMITIQLVWEVLLKNKSANLEILFCERMTSESDQWTGW